MHNLPTDARPIVRAAVNALNAFGEAISQREARTLLCYWARRDQLTSANIDQVLTHFSDERSGR